MSQQSQYPPIQSRESKRDAERRMIKQMVGMTLIIMGLMTFVVIVGVAAGQPAVTTIGIFGLLAGFVAHHIARLRLNRWRRG